MEAAAKLTSKGQVTVPKVVRDALGLAAGDEVVFGIRRSVTPPSVDSCLAFDRRTGQSGHVALSSARGLRWSSWNWKGFASRTSGAALVRVCCFCMAR
jgi:AbrB family looped-hinge helix DNA binding protein